jgi:heat shock protein HslJ
MVYKENCKMKIILSLLLYIMICTLVYGCNSSQNNKPDASFQNTYWVLREVDKKEYQVNDNDREINIVFFGENQMKGFGGCNQLSGGYEIEGKSIKISAASTRMYCDNKMEMESALMTALRETNKYDIDGDFLFLYKDNVKLAKFEAVYLK